MLEEEQEEVEMLFRKLPKTLKNFPAYVVPISATRLGVTNIRAYT